MNSLVIFLSLVFVASAQVPLGNYIEELKGFKEMWSSQPIPEEAIDNIVLPGEIEKYENGAKCALKKLIKNPHVEVI
jgi:hypothetical protein